MEQQVSTTKRTNLMNLPSEIRLVIYGHLFSHPTPIWIRTKYYGLKKPEVYKPTFHTSFFRVNKKAHSEAVVFAYSTHQFVLKDTFTTFTSLPFTTLAAFTTITIKHNFWTAENPLELRAWDCLKVDCVHLKYLNVELHKDLLLQSIRHLPEFFRALPIGAYQPTLTLIIYSWAEPFTTEVRNINSGRPSDMLYGRYVSSQMTPCFTDPQARVLHLPAQVKHIVLSAKADLSTVHALDSYLARTKDVLLTKAPEDVPKTKKRSSEERNRIRYTWTELRPTITVSVSRDDSSSPNQSIRPGYVETGQTPVFRENTLLEAEI